MGFRMRRYKRLVFALICATPLAASTQVPPLEPATASLRYDASIGVLPLGHMFVNIHETPLHYDMKIDTKSQGLVDVFAPIKSVAQVDGHRDETGNYVPHDYHSFNDRDGEIHDKKIHLTYGDTGHLASRERNPDDDPNWRPPVPAADVGTAADPITGFLQHRRLLHDAMANERHDASVTTYDGARLAGIHFHVVSPARIEIMGKYVDAINTVITRHPIAGYTPKELKKFNQGDPVMHVYFSADGRLMPLMMTIDLTFGEVKIVLTKDETPSLTEAK